MRRRVSTGAAGAGRISGGACLAEFAGAWRRRWRRGGAQRGAVVCGSAWWCIGRAREAAAWGHADEAVVTRLAQGGPWRAAAGRLCVAGTAVLSRLLPALGKEEKGGPNLGLHRPDLGLHGLTLGLWSWDLGVA
jgi:hypothetical protein